MIDCLVRPGQQAGKAASTAACSRPRSRTASATRPASRPSPSAPSSRPTTPTASSPPAAPTCARWPGRTWPIRPGPCTKRRRSATPPSAWPKQYLAGKAQLERNLERERQLAAASTRHVAAADRGQAAGGLMALPTDRPRRPPCPGDGRPAAASAPAIAAALCWRGRARHPDGARCGHAGSGGRAAGFTRSASATSRWT